MIGEVMTVLLGLSGPEALLLKAGAMLATDLLRRPEADSGRSTSVLSSVPGRLRLRVPAMRRAPQLAERLKARLSAIPGVKEADVNCLTGTALVIYNEGVVTSRLIQLAAESATAALRVIPASADNSLPETEPATGFVRSVRFPRQAGADGAFDLARMVQMLA